MEDGHQGIKKVQEQPMRESKKNKINKLYSMYNTLCDKLNRQEFIHFTIYDCTYPIHVCHFSGIEVQLECC